MKLSIASGRNGLKEWKSHPPVKKAARQALSCAAAFPTRQLCSGSLSQVRSLNLTLMEVKRINRLATNVNEVDLDNL